MSNLSDSAVLEPPASTEAPNAESFTPQGEYSQRELALLARLSLKVTPAVSARSRCDETMDAIKLCFVKFLWAVSAFLLVRLSGCF